MSSTRQHDLIGIYSIDLPHVYYEEGHELHRRWVSLSAPAWSREGVGLQLGNATTLRVVEDDDGGVQGFVKLSLTLLGPGDKQPVHSGDSDDDEGRSGALLMPPSIKRELLFLVVGVLRAEQLPDMDRKITGAAATHGLDAYVLLKFNGCTPELGDRSSDPRHKTQGTTVLTTLSSPVPRAPQMLQRLR